MANKSAVSLKKVSDLTPDGRNANKGSARGNALIERSLRKYGAGRSILLDRNGAIIAGNKTAENWSAAGMVLNSTDTWGRVLDPFGGSGSTMIACEKTARKCFMMELDPAYCDVICQRWETATGKRAKLEGTNG